MTAGLTAATSRRAPLAECAFNLAMGASVWSWAVLGWLQETPEARVAAPRLCVIALNFLVGVLFVVRRPMRRGAAWAQIAICLPAFVCAGAVWRSAPSPEAWPTHAAWPFVLAAAWVIVSLLWLGRDFAILPAVRTVVHTGPYRFVRHPVYLGEWLMIVCAAAARSPLHAVAAGAICLPLIGLRIHAEEQLLCTARRYRAYCKLVRSRLIPGVW